MTQEIMTPEVTLGWAHLVEAVPADSEYNAGKFDAVIWYSKKDTDFHQQILDLTTEAVKEKWADKAPKKINLPNIIDGDEQSYENKDGDEVYPNEGKWGFRAASNRKPVVVDKYGSPISDATEIGFDPKGKVKVNAFAWTFGTRNGVSFGLNTVMITDKGNFGAGSGGDPLAGFEFEAA